MGQLELFDREELLPEQPATLKETKRLLEGVVTLAENTRRDIPTRIADIDRIIRYATTRIRMLQEEEAYARRGDQVETSRGTPGATRKVRDGA